MKVEMEHKFGDVARLWIEGGRLRFEGNATEAAKIFIEGYVKPLVEAEIENRLKGTAGAYVPGGSERAVKGPTEERGKKSKGEE